MNKTEHKKQLSPAQRAQLLATLEARFEKNRNRHKDLEWSAVEAILVKDDNASNAKLWSLQEMESSGGEPDVIGVDKNTGEYIFCDCVTESPAGRRNACYDREAQEGRKANKPKNNATDMAAEMGIEMLTEKAYRALQQLGRFDTKTSSWLKTPAEIRKLGGAIFGDHRYGQVFVYHNGAQSYYAARGFRGLLRV
ncbi:MAG TPA: DUF4256 domain-containing protein [Flavisolibacter sp.]|nr:DUF4256 domain-containing protein [Flavisolibacter sp.]